MITPRTSSTVFLVFFVHLVLLLVPGMALGEQLGDEHELPVRMPEAARLFFPACASLPFDESRLVELLRIELLDDGIQLGIGESPDDDAVQTIEAHLRIDIPGCVSGSNISIVVESPTTGRAQRRRIGLSDDAGGERVLALALTELLRRSWSALAPVSLQWEHADGQESPDETLEVEDHDQQPPPDVPSTEPDVLSRAQEEAVREAVEHEIALSRPEEPPLRSRFFVDFSADGSAYPTFSTGFIGGSLGASFAIASLPIRIEPAIGTRYGMASDPLGYIDMGTLYAALALIFGNRDGLWLLGIGPSIEFGWSWAKGRPFEEETRARAMDAPFVTVSLQGTVRRRLTERLWLTMGGSLGYAAVGFAATAEGRYAGALEGIQISLHLGLSIALS